MKGRRLAAFTLLGSYEKCARESLDPLVALSRALEHEMLLSRA